MFPSDRVCGRYEKFAYDGVTGATPLAQIRNGEEVNVMDMLIGRIPGTIGEISVICILIGAIFLILMGVIDLRIPGTYIVTFVIFLLLFGGHGFDWNYIVAELCGGGLMLGAFFMATDYVTSPITPRGQIIRYLSWNPDRTFPCLWCKRRRCILLDHLMQPVCTDH